jgi:YggT family protein
VLAQIATLLVDVVTSFFVYLLLARFLFQWLRVPFRNVAGNFIIAATNWMVAPARRVIPSLFGLDLASLLLAWLIQGLALWAIYALAGISFASSPDIAAGILAGLALVDLLRFVVYFFIFVLIVLVVLSWVAPHSDMMPVCNTILRPLLRPIRRFVPLLGNFDLSPLILIVILQVLLIPLAHLRGLAAGLF